MYKKTVSLFLILITLSCTQQEIKEPGEQILVNIDNKVTISLNEFLRRAEYTIRPPYARDNSYLTKKVILNSLIAEKLFALEAGEDNDFLKQEEIQLFIKGRREQAMRQYMHYLEATELVRIDTAEIKKYYPYAGREYDISYFVIPDSLQSANKEILKKTPDFKSLYQQVYGDTSAPKRKVTFHNSENQVVLDALYGQDVKKNQVLQPMRIENGMLYMKVLGWKNTMAITENQVLERSKKIKEALTMNKSSVIWNKKVAEIMKGKTVSFDESTFWEITQIFYELYFSTQEKKIESIQEKIWDIEKDPEQAFQSLEDRSILNKPLLTIDGQTWTVADFRKELIRHPLVYRDRRMPARSFAKELRLAIADLIRDKYVTEEAYKKGYDKVNIVQRNERMWKDALVSVYERDKYLKSVNEKRDAGKNYISIIGDHLNSFVDSLQVKYYKKIELDFDAFENITLSTIDLYTSQRNQPFQQVVPMFPILTTDHMIEYVTKMKKEQN
ncbi:MAG: hypothetical protein H6627_04615 [Calditrichae bacterium]|nr:hypothetical protein [Calditrichota bacterium]MCB9057824.1 hypothetical protein [Calditrichia bacterium]